MIAQILKKTGYCICSNCRMKQPELNETCWFCESFFSNYEELLLESYKESEYENVHR